MSDKHKVRLTSVCHMTEVVTDRLNFGGHHLEDFQSDARMLEAEATADMPVMTRTYTASKVTEEPLEAILVKAVLEGEQDRFARL